MSGGPVHAFVVGSGRSGTRTLAELLDALPGCTFEHERRPPLLEELTAYRDGSLPRAGLLELLRATRSPEAIGGARLSGESNQRLSFLLPELHEAFPEARVVWLLRDGRAAVASMAHRSWYHPREAEIRSPRVSAWARHRLAGDASGDLSPREWAGLDPFGRCCWYWSYANRTIAEALPRLGARTLTLRLEDIDRRLPELAAFLDLDEIPARPRAANAATAGTPLHWRRWSQARRATFERLCGAEMDVHYPRWREETERGLGARVGAAVARGAVEAREAVAAASRPARARVGLAHRRRARRRG